MAIVLDYEELFDWDKILFWEFIEFCELIVEFFDCNFLSLALRNYCLSISQSSPSACYDCKYIGFLLDVPKLNWSKLMLVVRLFSNIFCSSSSFFFFFCSYSYLLIIWTGLAGFVGFVGSFKGCFLVLFCWGLVEFIF